ESRVKFRDLVTSHESLQLEALTGDVGLDALVPDADIAAPGLALAGYTDRFIPDRLHVLGETEVTYLASLSEGDRRSRLEAFFHFDLPAVFITKGLEPPEPLLE